MYDHLVHGSFYYVWLFGLWLLLLCMVICFIGPSIMYGYLAQIVHLFVHLVCTVHVTVVDRSHLLHFNSDRFDLIQFKLYSITFYHAHVRGHEKTDSNVLHPQLNDRERLTDWLTD